MIKDPVIDNESRTELAEARTEQAEFRTKQAKTRTEQAEARTEQAETRTEQAKTRTEQAEVRTEQAEVRTEEAETRNEELIRSSELKYRLLAAELEQRVEERTRQLTAANDGLEAFSYSISHDLRAPLRHVLGFAELLKKEAGSALTGKSLEHLTTICRSVTKMGQLIDDLLAFAQVGNSELKKTEINLDWLIQEVVGEFLSETKARHITWTIRPLPPVTADRALLRMVLVNLLSNAVKFTSGRTEAKIEVGSTPGKHETVIFVRDNGVGFDEQFANKLFVVFQRLHSAEDFEGTGIGLANVQRIIHKHNGRVWAVGEVDKGATFYFSIPDAC